MSESSKDAIPALKRLKNFHPLEVVSRYRDPQLQVGENYSHLFNLRPKTSDNLAVYMFVSFKMKDIYLIG